MPQVLPELFTLGRLEVVGAQQVVKNELDHAAGEIRGPDLFPAMSLGIVDGYMRCPLAAIEREFVQADRQWTARGLRLATNGLGYFMYRPLVQLDRRHREAGIAKSEPQLLDGIAGAVNRDRMIVWVDGAHVVREGPNSIGAEVKLQVVLLAQIPLQSHMMAEAGDHFAVEELSFGAQLTVVQLAFVGFLRLVEDEVEKDA